MISRVKGTQDFLDLTLYNFIIDQAKKHLIEYNFSEISTPIIEPLDLFKRSLGEYTDVVSKEMFVIDAGDKEDKICLRPEATASTIRAFIENNVQQIPWKVFSYGPMFRYERPQKGRYRQFHQLNIEVIGAQSIAQDVQLIKMLDRFFDEKLNINNYVLNLNFLGCFDDRKEYRVLLQEFLNNPEAEVICKTCKERAIRSPLRVFDCKNTECQKLYKNAPTILENLCNGCEKEWEELQRDLQLLSVSFVVNPSLVRGLDYYNKTVFEFASDNLGAQNAFCGGGRYDQLVGQLGARQDQPSLGAAIGLERVMLLLQSANNNLAIPRKPALHVIAPLSHEQYALALLVADTLQAHNLCTDLLLEGGSIKSMMRTANKMGAAYVLILGDKEQKDKSVTVKNMMTGTQETIAQINVVSYVTR